MEEAKVLLVDDEPEFLETLAARMAGRGLRVDTASNGEEALRKAEQTEYDAVIVDMFMPGIDGLETLKRLKKTKPEFQVILLTGHASLEQGLESIKLGALDFLEKPADLDALLAKIREARSKRLILVDKEREKWIQDILKRKGW
jgi:DNA-binding NtrC family response regulator